MQHWGAWGRRAIALATIVLSLTVLSAELAMPAGAAVGPGLRHPARTEAQRKARVIAAMRARGYTKAAKLLKLRAAANKTGATARKRANKYRVTGRKRAKKPNANARRAATQRRLRLRRQSAAARRRAALAAQRASKKQAPLSLPLLGFLAILPFVVIGLYLLGTDYWRRRADREPRGPRRRGGASLVITRVGDR